jgi:hypothetical protein
MQRGGRAEVAGQPGHGLRRCAGAKQKEDAMRGALLWLVGIPIPIIILLYLFGVL